MVTFKLLHIITETDFGDRHSWQSSALRTAHDDEQTVRSMHDDVVAALRNVGVQVTTVESTVRHPFPREW